MALRVPAGPGVRSAVGPSHAVRARPREVGQGRDCAAPTRTLARAAGLWPGPSGQGLDSGSSQMFGVAAGDQVSSRARAMHVGFQLVSIHRLDVVVGSDGATRRKARPLGARRTGALGLACMQGCGTLRTPAFQLPMPGIFGIPHPWCINDALVVASAGFPSGRAKRCGVERCVCVCAWVCPGLGCPTQLHPGPGPGIRGRRTLAWWQSLVEQEGGLVSDPVTPSLDF